MTDSLSEESSLRTYKLLLLIIYLPSEKHLLKDASDLDSEQSIPTLPRRHFHYMFHKSCTCHFIKYQYFTLCTLIIPTPLQIFLTKFLYVICSENDFRKLIPDFFFSYRYLTVLSRQRQSLIFIQDN